MNRFVLIILILSFAVLAHGQAADELHSRIKKDVEERNYQPAITDLRLFAETEPRLFALNNYDYLLARLCENTNDLACALKMYNAVASRDSVLREYALWHLASMARLSSNLLMERVQLMELSIAAPNSLLTQSVRRRMARSWFESKNYDLAIKTLNGDPNALNSAEPKMEREDRLLLGRAYLFNGNLDKARDIFNELMTTVANPAQPDDFALEAVKALDLIEVGSDKFGRDAPKLSDYEHLRRAQIYQFNRDFADARLHFFAIINEHPTSGIAPDATYQIGRGYSQSGNYTEAVKWYERVGEQFADQAVDKEALLQLATAYARLGKRREAIGRYEKYIEKYPDDERVDRPYLNIIDVYRDLGEETEALNWAAKTQEIFQGKTGEAQALFTQARMHLSRSSWADALADLDRLKTIKDLGGTLVPGGTNTAEVTFLRGYALEQLRRYPEAIEAYLSIPDGRNEYYGWRATERLQAMSADNASKAAIEERLNLNLTEQPTNDLDARRRRWQSALRLVSDKMLRDKLLGDLRKNYAESPSYKAMPRFKLLDVGRKEMLKADPLSIVKANHQTIADELLFLDLYDEASPELEAAKKGTANPVKIAASDLDYTIAYCYLKGDRADRAAAFIEPLLKIPADYMPELLPPIYAEMLYPAPYTAALLKYAPSREVDPRFLLSIMRQESRFRANVKSVAAARGLMQFISTTSDDIAVELSRTNFDQNELYYPPTAILFGSQYVGNLFKLFPAKPDAVSASYNGGEDNMKRWFGRAKSDQPYRYVPEIEFSQSKDYVYRVMSNYRMYQMLYDEKLKRK